MISIRITITIAVLWLLSVALLLLLGRTAAEARTTRPDPPRPVWLAIRLTFRERAAEALRVAWCESRFDIKAINGQYLGLFQMGDYARSKYGHGNTAMIQARAAHRYFVDSGRDWSPWSCKP